MRVYMTINSAHTVYLPGTREVASHIVCHRWGQVVTARLSRARMHPRTRGVISHRRFHVGAAGVCDRFHHLDESVLMNILIIPPNARACWVSSRPPFPEINMEERGRGGKAESDLMHLLARRQQNLSIGLTCCHFVTIFGNKYPYLHCWLLKSVTN